MKNTRGGVGHWETSIILQCRLNSDDLDTTTIGLLFTTLLLGTTVM